MPNRAFALELKGLTEKGEFSGLASTYGNVDQVGDIVEPGAFTKTLASSKERPLLWNHRDPIGTVQLTDSPIGLLVRGRLSLAIQKGAEAYTLLQDRVVTGLSIGFETIRSDLSGAVRHLREVRLWEVSLTWIPANQRALITAVKSLDHNRIQSVLKGAADEILRALERKNQ